MKLLKHLSNIISEYAISDTLGDLGAAAIGATGFVGMPAMVALIAKNVNEITNGSDILQSEMDKFINEPTIESFKTIKNNMDTVTTDLLDLSSRLVQLVPDPTALSDMGAFAGEQLLQLGLTEELPAILDKTHKIIDAVPFVGKTEVVKAMDIVGSAHELLQTVGEAFEDFKESTQ